MDVPDPVLPMLGALKVQRTGGLLLAQDRAAMVEGLAGPSQHRWCYLKEGL